MESFALNKAGRIKVFAANGCMDLAKSVVEHLGLTLGKSDVTRFSDGEVNLKINESVRGADVFIIQSTSPPVNDHLMELLIMIDAMRRSSAGRITAVVPYFGYARQDRRAQSHDPISAKLVADLITVAGANRILSIDLHCPQIQGFFNIPMDHLRGNTIFADHIKKNFSDLSDFMVISPDLGSVKRSSSFAVSLGVPMAIVNKHRTEDNKNEVIHFIGDVKGKTTILVDDQIASGTSICNAAFAAVENGAKEVYACITHPVLCGNATKKLNASPIKELFVLDTIEVSKEKLEDCPKIKVLSVANFLGEAIRCIHTSQSLGAMFKMVGENENEG